MKANVLGTEYTIITDAKAEEYDHLGDCDGYADLQTKEIIIEEMTETPHTTKDIKSYEKHVIRHELVHAFLYESGLTEYTEDELLVDWLALQFPKMAKLFEELNI